MALNNLNENLNIEKEILKELLVTNSQIQNLYNLYPYEKREIERKLLLRVINSLTQQLKIINDSIPEIVEAISPFKGLEKEEQVKNLVKINYNANPENKISVTIASKNRESFLKELSLSRETLTRLKLEKEKKIKKEDIIVFKKANAYARISNSFFQDSAGKLIDKGYFLKLNTNLRKSNMPYLLVTYLSMLFFSTMLGLIGGILGFLLMVIVYPSLVYYGIALIPVIPAVVFFSFYFYPNAEKQSLSNRIDQEIPFATIHMAAIASSGIEPSQIFKILAVGEEYPYTKTEIKKIINQINVYGYDLVSALKNTARETASRKFSELLNGMAASISGGSELITYLDKRAESLLFEYRIEREKRTKSAETFMDIYISLMIAAPMIMTLLLVLIVVSSIDIGLTVNSLTIIILSVVSLMNIAFLVFLHLSGGTEND